ncbi:uncharacterized protein B0T15DRAFT_508205 [Chaetomium strumarium]|uniref:Uncharacterized protein n=1 Tax=Chaetomium strumarium TaxID=1170767 RepID=A0AAJ0H508_9PEZI|nr:hypothetical protein B0T15DRAFT_508205 [Chaetomium strumarium]
MNATLSASANSSSSFDIYQLVGWVSSDTTRGSIDILWICCVIIILCCWVSTFPNVPSMNDKWYHPLVDKANLAFVGLLGPNFLFTIALGQLSSARRSVRLFRTLPQRPLEWSLVHGFFADMGGFHLASADYSPFPVNAEQLHYLIRYGHVDFPNLTKRDIKALSHTDGLSKLLILWQVLWFSVSELQRIREGLPMTTFELTALPFSLIMLITSLCWFPKPTISRPIILYTKDGRSIEHIRMAARNSTHPDLRSIWYRTPLDFISPYRRFRVDVHWSKYEQLTYMVRVPLFSREIRARPWDRLPSAAWLVIDRTLFAPAFLVNTVFGVSPLAAWNFHFATHGERLAWRMCGIYHALFSISLGVYYIYVVLHPPQNTEAGKAPGTAGAAATTGNTSSSATLQAGASPSEGQQRQGGGKGQAFGVTASADVEARLANSAEHVSLRRKRIIQAAVEWLDRWRNISPDGDPDMEIGLRATFLPLAGTFLYIFCRMFFYVECFIAIRQQPVGVYKAMNKFLPFMN